MIVIKFLGLLLLGMFLVYLILLVKNTIDAEINRHYIIKDVRKTLLENVYIIMKANEEMRNELINGGFEEEDADDFIAYLRNLPREKIEEEVKCVYDGKMPFNLDEILGDKDEK